MKKNISIIGSTGSIGTQTLEVARHLGIGITAITASTSVDLMEKQVREFAPSIAVLRDESAAIELKKRIADTSTEVLAGEDGIIAAAREKTGAVVTSIVGMAGLRPTMEAIEVGNNIALANKETLVCAGALVKSAVKKQGVELLPVDSEHCAIFQCLACGAHSEVRRIILTASGGPFFGKKKEELAAVRVEDALKHPNWSMGRKITIDSATMMNKGLELIEAMHLFDVDESQITVAVQRQSIIHSAVEFADASLIAQLGVPDMRLPIQFALTYPDRSPSLTDPIDFSKPFSIDFAPPDDEAFPALRLARTAAKMGDAYGAVLNAANEAAVDMFLNCRIKFLDIAKLVEKALEKAGDFHIETVEDVIACDKEVRARTYEFGE